MTNKPIYTLPRKRGVVYIRLYNTLPQLAHVQAVPESKIPEKYRKEYEALIHSTNRRVECVPNSTVRTGSMKVDIPVTIGALTTPAKEHSLASYLIAMYHDDIAQKFTEHLSGIETEEAQSLVRELSHAN